MKRKMIGAAAAYMSGLFFASFFADAKGLLMYIAAAVLVWCYGRKKNFSRADYGIIAASFITAVVVSFTYTAAVYRPAVSYDGTVGSFTGKVTEYTKYDGDRTSYTLSGRINGVTKAKISYYGSDLDADHGDIISFGECGFRTPESDYLFDSEGWYRSRHVYLEANHAKDITVTHTDSRKLKKLITAFREDVISQFRTELGEDCGGFLAGMVFGEKHSIGGNTRTALYRTGIGHVLSVSGLHVSVIAALLMLLLGRLNVNRYASFALVNVLILGLAAMANYPVSAVRAAIMLDIMYSASLFRRQNDSFNSLATAALLISLTDPYCIYNPGFMLSLSGTFGVAVFAPYMRAKMERATLPQKLSAALVTAICATISVFPLSLYYFDETSLVSPFTNIILLPLCSAAMILGLVHIITFGLIPALYAAGGIVKAILLISDAVSKVGAFHVSDGSGLLRSLLIIAGAAAVLVYMFTESRRKTSVFIACSVAVFSIASAASGIAARRGFRAAVLGSGKNAAVVIVHDGRADIVDLSGHYRSAGYVRKYLTVNGIDAADTLLLTKNVQSQYSAYEKELELFPVKQWIASGETLVYGGEAQPAVSESFIFDSSGCVIDYDGGALAVTYKGREISFVPADENGGDTGIRVYYGRLKSDAVPDRGGIYLDENENTDEQFSGINDFEIVMSGNGKYRIRRL